MIDLYKEHNRRMYERLIKESITPMIISESFADIIVGSGAWEKWKDEVLIAENVMAKVDKKEDKK